MAHNRCEVAVTGATGFVGRHVCSALLKVFAPDDIRVLTRDHSKSSLFAPGTQVVWGSLEDTNATKRFVSGARAIVHLASGTASERDDEPALRRINVEATARLYAAAVEAGCSTFVHVSTAGVYGQPRLAGPLSEDAAVNPVTAYQRTKWEGERALLNAQHGATTLNIVRPADLYGPGSRVHISSYSKLAQRRWSLELPGDILLHPTHVRDLAAAIVALVLRPASHGTIFNIAGERPTRRNELHALAAEFLGLRLTRIVVPPVLAAPMTAVRAAVRSFKGRPVPMLAQMGRGAVFSTTVDDARFRQAYSDVPVVPLREGVREHIDWARSQGLLD